jgi:hypothetical protein
MFYLDIDKTYNQNLGLSQNDRLLKALEKDFFLIDEFDFKSFIEFTSAHANQIAYFNDRNILDGDWTSFFNHDPTLSLLKIAFYDIALIQPKEYYFLHKKRNTAKAVQENIIFNLENLLKHFKSLELNLTNLQLYADFKSETEKLIAFELSSIFNQSYIYLNKLQTITTLFSQNEFGAYWSSFKGQNKTNKDLIAIAKDCYGFFKKTNLIFETIKESAVQYYEENIIKSKKVAPHVGLLMAFHNMYNEARQNLNNITFKHHDYYLKNVLQIPLKSKKPDTVHLNFSVANNLQVEILKGEELTAGTNEEGKEIIYKIDKTLLINPATIKEITGFEFKDDKYVNNPNLTQLDSEKRTINFRSPENKIGFSFGSEFLSLEEGVRKITFEFNFSKNSLKSFFESFGQDPVINDNSLLNLFNISYSCEEGWFHITDNKVETSLKFLDDKADNSILQIIVLVDNIDPAIIPLELENSDYKDHPSFPIFQFFLNNYNLSAYHSFKLLDLNCINVGVEILDVKNLLLSNDFGDIEASAPFEPFGSQPLMDSSFIIGHPNFFLYPINDIRLNLEWYGLPLFEGGFSSYYSEYPWEVDNESFEVKVSYLRNKRWAPEKDKQVINLFQDVPDDSGAVSNVRRVNEINIRELDLHLPSLSKKNAVPFNNQSKDGFLKFELCFPLEGFGHQQYPEIVRESTMKSVKNKNADVTPPNEPYTPTLKSISADFKMNMSYNQENSSDFNFYHIHPVGTQKVEEINSLLPIYEDGSTLIIAINNTDSNKQFSILFQINEAFANKATNDLMLKWSYNNGERWVEMNDNQLLSDKTNDLKSSGIIDFNLEDSRFDKSGLYDSDVLLIKAESLNKSSFLSYLQDILIHATTATCYNVEDVNYSNIAPNQITEFRNSKEDLELIQQKYHGFKGVSKEDIEGYFLRSAERLRHKNRAVSGTDYEKIILENFPQVNRVKCLSNIDANFKLSPGNVLIVVVPKIIDDSNFLGVPRYFSTVEIQQMQKFLKPIVPLGVNYKVTNPIYEQVQVKFSLKLHDGFDKKFYVQKLNEGIRSFISPWMYNLKFQVELGQTISSALILNFIDKQEYVDHVVNFSLFHIVNGLIINQKTAKSNTVEIKPTSLISVLTSDFQHIILPYEEGNETDNFGINEMMIDTDYVVDYANKEENLEEENLKIEKSYKILPTKEDNKSVSSNFTFYITA